MQLAGQALAKGLRHHDAADRGGLLQPRRDVDRDAKHVPGLLEDVTHMQADTKVQRHAARAVLLFQEFQGRRQRVAGCREKREQIVSGKAGFAAVVAANDIAHARPVPVQADDRSGRILRHEARIADRIGHENRPQHALHRF